MCGKGIPLEYMKVQQHPSANLQIQCEIQDEGASGRFVVGYKRFWALPQTHIYLSACHFPLLSPRHCMFLLIEMSQMTRTKITVSKDTAVHSMQGNKKHMLFFQ